MGEGTQILAKYWGGGGCLYMAKCWGYGCPDLAAAKPEMIHHDPPSNDL